MPVQRRGEAERPVEPDLVSPLDLPPAVARTRATLLDAAARQDWTVLDSLAGWAPGPEQSGFLYTLGVEMDTPTEYWRTHYEPEAFFQEMTAILSSDAIASNGSYTWPSWSWSPLDRLSAADRRLFKQTYPDTVGLYMEQGYYVGMMTSIDSTGRWADYAGGE